MLGNKDQLTRPNSPDNHLAISVPQSAKRSSSPQKVGQISIMTANDKEAGLEDLLRVDKNLRTVLHRAALDQNVKLIQQLCEQAKKVGLHDYVDKTDKFGNSSLLSACVAGNGQSKLECVKLLLNYGSDPNKRNNTTLWTPLTWCAYYGDTEIVKELLERRAFPYWPDKQGLYPLDQCGLQDKHGDRKATAKVLIEKLMFILEDYESSKEHQALTLSRYGENIKYIATPLLRASVLYWSLYYNLNMKRNITKLLEMENVYPELPMKSLYGRNCYHACCFNGNKEGLVRLFEIKERYNKCYQKHVQKKNLQNIGRSKAVIEKEVVEKISIITSEEKRNETYSDEFLEYVNEATTWIIEFEQMMEKVVTEDSDPLKYFEIQDSFGNTPLHIASFLGKTEIVEILLNQNVDIHIENKDGWRCEELKQYKSIEQLYKTHMKKTHGNFMVEALKKNIGLEMQLMFGNKTPSAASQKANKGCFGNMFGKSQKVGASDKVTLYEGNLIEKSSLYSEERFIPDVVLVFPTIKSNTKVAAALLERINFTISLLQTNFDCYMASDIGETSCYLMIKMKQEELENECTSNGIKIKLLNNYGHEQYDSTRKVDFEPFRSRQRQEITITSLKKLIDIQQLTDLKSLKQIYTMHTVSGIQRIKEIWLNSKWYWPQPLVSMKDYFKEGKHLNFSAITTLRMYFGEKFSFYFAWTSFYTCYLLLMAIPGLVITIFIRRDDSTSSYLLPIYVVYNSLCSTLVVEKWKRKSAEIATRWGTIDMASSTGSEKVVRNEFIGDEVPEETTGTLTKKNPKKNTVLYFLISVPILLLLLAAVIATFLWTQAIEEDHPNMSSVNKILVSAVNGITIAVLNFLYGAIANYFVKKENHKYTHTYEKSLIFKVFLFRFLNSYIGLFYLIFVKGKHIDSLFYTLISLLATKQVTAVAIGCIVPWVRYKLQKKNYFKAMNNKGFEQWRLKKVDEQNKQEEDPLSPVKTGDKTKTDFVVKRPVLNCRTGRLETNQWALTRIELNALRIRKDDFIEDYSQMLIQYGYITMFASLCPIGPLIGFIANIVDLRSKIFAYLHIHHRPPAQKAANIGIWNNIWEIMSIFGIIMNALILFFRSTSSAEFFEEGIMDPVPSKSPASDIRRLWVFIIVVHVILILKFLVSAFILDKPEWVLKEAKKQNSIERLAIQNNKSGSLFGTKITSRTQFDNAVTNQVITEEASLSFQDNDTHNADEPSGFDLPLSPIGLGDRKASRPEKHFFGLLDSQQQAKELLETPREVYHEAPQKALPLASTTLDLNNGIKTLIFSAFTYIEKDLTMKRIERLSEFITELVVKCHTCKQEKGLFECIGCKENYCNKCLKEVHSKPAMRSHKIVSLLTPNSANTSRHLNDSTTGLIDQQKQDKSNLKLIDATKGAAQSKTQWRKIESFDFPTYIGGDSHANLKKVYRVLYQIYIAGNGISSENTITDNELAFKFKKKGTKLGPNIPANARSSQPDQDGNTEMDSLKIIKGVDTLFSKETELGEINFSWFNELKKFFELSLFNVEEKILLNRVAFLVFKKRGAKTTYNDFYRQTKILAEGTFESKAILLFDLMDEDGDGSVSIKDLEKVLNMSLIQNTESNTNYDEAMNTIFQEHKMIDKKTWLNLMLNSGQIKEILEAYLQTQK